MKRVCKFLLCFLMVFTLGMFISKTFADEKLEVVDMIQEDYYSAVLYSDGSVYFWNQRVELKLDNVKKIIGGRLDCLFLDNDNNLKNKYYYDDSFEDIASNVKDFDFNYYLTNDNKLYYYYEDNINYDGYNVDEIMVNVKEWEIFGTSLLILDNNNSLYAYGTNVFGKKINDGEDIIDSPIKLDDNVIKYDREYYIKDNGDLYFFDSNLALPKKIFSKITDAYFEDEYYSSNRNYYVRNGKTYKFRYEIKNGSVNIFENNLFFDEEIDLNSILYYGNYILTKNNELFYISGDKKKLVDSDVKEVLNNMYLKNNGEVYSFDYYNSESKYLLKNVDRIINNSSYDSIYTFVMKDGTILTKGNESNYDIGNYGGIEGKNYKNYVVIEGLPNVPNVIKPIEITMDSLNKTEFVVGDTFDYYATVYPYNSTDKEITWSSSNPDVVTVDQKGTLKFVGEGNATISVKFDNYDISDSVEVKVYPKVSGIVIDGGDTLTFNKSDYIVLTANFLPDNSLVQNVIWSTDAGTYEEIDGSIHDYIYFNRDYCVDDECNKNQVNIGVRKTGKYTITATTEDGLYSDSIEIVVKQDITSMGFDVDTNNILGSTLYMYLKEADTMDLKVRVYPEDVTNKELKYESSDESIATVDKNGIVTGHKDGKVTITIKAVQGDAERKINILVFDEGVSTKVGDIDGDGEVDIFDLIQLRISLAGDDVE